MRITIRTKSTTSTLLLFIAAATILTLTVIATGIMQQQQAYAARFSDSDSFSQSNSGAIFGSCSSTAGTSCRQSPSFSQLNQILDRDIICPTCGR